MKKVVVHSPGGYEKLVIEDHPTPTPQGDEVVVETSAVGVNYADCCVRWGVYESAKKYVGWPITPGFEFAGAVVAAGPKATHKVGDKVFGVSRFGGYATHVCAPSHQIFKIPRGMTEQQAAAFPSVYMTAYHAVHQLVRIRKNGTVLIHSAAGGVGTALLQVCKIAGFHTVGVVGASHKVQFAKDFGADVVIDKSKEDLWARAKACAPEGYDAVFDANGYTTYNQSYEHLRATGKLVVYGTHSLLPTAGGRINYIKAGLGMLRTPRFNPFKMIVDNRSVVGFNVSFLFDRTDLLDEGMADMLAWIEQGKLKPPGVTEFPFEKVSEAHKLIESAQSVGKLVLVHQPSQAREKAASTAA